MKPIEAEGAIPRPELNWLFDWIPGGGGSPPVIGGGGRPPVITIDCEVLIPRPELNRLIGGGGNLHLQ